MPRTSDVDGFTPIFDGVTRDVGLLASAVYGRVYRYAQGADSVCRASIERLATDLDLSTRTVIRYLKTLVEEGYLVDLTPNLRNRPHSYRTTDRASTMTESHTTESVGVTESHGTMTESQGHYDRESLEETIEETTEENPDELFSQRGGKEKTTVEKESILNCKDVLSMSAEVMARRNGEPDWAIDGPEGASPYYPVLVAFCTITRRPTDLKAKMGRRWLRQFEQIAENQGLDPGWMHQATLRLGKSKGAEWYLEQGKWTSPFIKSYEEQVGLLGNQMRAGMSPSQKGVTYTND